MAQEAVNVLSSSMGKAKFLEDNVMWTSFVVWDGTDPFTLPHTSFEWKHDGWLGTPSVTVHKQFLHSTVYVQVWGPTLADAENQVKGCLQEAAILGALAGIAAAYASSGTAGISAALSVFAADLKTCLKKKVGQVAEQIKVQTQSVTKWEDWT